MAKATSGGAKGRRGVGAKAAGLSEVEAVLEGENTPVGKTGARVRKQAQTSEKVSKKPRKIAAKKVESGKAGARAKASVKKAVKAPLGQPETQPETQPEALPLVPAALVAPAMAAETQTETAVTAEAVAAQPHFDDLPWGESPADLPVPEGGEQPGLGWMTQVIAISTVLLLLLNSFAVDKWARSLPVSAESGQIIDAADAWHGMMGSLYLNAPLETGRSAWHWLKELQWPGGDEAADADQGGTSQPVDQ